MAQAATSSQLIAECGTIEFFDWLRRRMQVVLFRHRERLSAIEALHRMKQ